MGRVLVAGDDGGGVERGELVECGDPFGPAAGGRGADVHVAVVVGDVAGDDQVQVRHVQRGGVHGVGVSGFDHVETGTLQLEGPVIEWLGDRDRVGGLTRGTAAGPGVSAAASPSGGRAGAG